MHAAFTFISCNFTSICRCCPDISSFFGGVLSQPLSFHPIKRTTSGVQEKPSNVSISIFKRLGFSHGQAAPNSLGQKRPLLRA
ncbi:hypothetical protein BaRGS_00034278 [Batillaria attramentaria]|uniref:Uncharacterized protein n=1 Tax=Batillaria attramentaria TaxID=370345 RepID=A0ABD0JI00_9CAEN